MNSTRETEIRPYEGPDKPLASRKQRKGDIEALHLQSEDHMDEVGVESVMDIMKTLYAKATSGNVDAADVYLRHIFNVIVEAHKYRRELNYKAASIIGVRGVKMP